MIAIALAFLAGLLFVQQFSALPDSGWLIVLMLLAALLAWRGHGKYLVFTLGILWALLFAMSRLSNRLPASLEGQELWVTGYVADLPETDSHKTRFDFVVTSSASPLPRIIRLSWYRPRSVLKAGQHWSLQVKLKRPHGNLNPGGFDYERWLFTENIGATGYVRDYPPPLFIKQDSAWQNTTVWRQTLADQLSLRLQNQPQLALIKALTIGDGSAISPHQWEVFRQTGTTHLVVISGSHVGLIAGLGYFLALKLWARTGILAISPPLVAALVAMVTGLFYAALAGFSVPTLRALIMLAIVMGASILQRHTRPFNTLSTALLAVLAYDPLAVLAAGFWLSFLAVAVIVYATSARLATATYWRAAWDMNWATSVGLSPLLLYFFQQVSLVSPLANLLAVPVIGVLLVPMALLATLLMWVLPPVAIQLFRLVDWGLQGLWWLLAKLAELPWATLSHPQPSVWALALAVPGILWLLAPRGIPARWLSVVLFLPLLFPPSLTPKPGDFKVTLLDVGQGLAVVVQTAQHSLVFDTGARFSAETDMGQSVVLPFLRQQGLAKVDTLVVSHGDNDHIGGAESLLRGMTIARVLTSVPQQLGDYAPLPCKAGDSWVWDGVRFTLLAPQKVFASDNDNSCVLKVANLHGAVLLTGDIQASAEAWLLQTYGQQLHADVLVAPHHGSKTSSTAPFLNAVKPTWVLIPAGYRNPFGHPHPEVVRRYEQLPAHWLNNADSGAITASMANGVWEVQSMRDLSPRYWHVK